MKKYKLATLASLILMVPLVIQQPAMDWKNVCAGPDSSKVSYCKEVGKDAFNATGSAVLREVKLGKIIGVCWRPQGSIISYSPPIPAANIPAETRTSPRDAFYYIIDDGAKDEEGKPRPFLRQCREIEAKRPPSRLMELLKR